MFDSYYPFASCDTYKNEIPSPQTEPEMRVHCDALPKYHTPAIHARSPRISIGHDSDNGKCCDIAKPLARPSQSPTKRPLIPMPYTAPHHIHTMENYTKQAASGAIDIPTDFATLSSSWICTRISTKPTKHITHSLEGCECRFR